ncbi:YmaF family protein [Clostridium algidicarnis]|nr:YmaF family protein [Clostridium algidicarnis]MBU3197468.1 YmaF family protein [Clostridium algidicarnis]MBU3210489.1 YmaF family protein [Clostridium algidicarnis]MBU3228153.1 YmaF family protein [Clostridium algidicarnis]MBU3252037.1 YmaF family protein [Clostridium algidicarnis]
MGVTTGSYIPIPNSNKHLHLINGVTILNKGRFHEFLFTTQINSPLV